MTTMPDDQATRPAVVLERTFDAPPALVWRLWTEPDHFRAWYGPGGAEVPEAVMDVRVGGQRRISMTANDGAMRMWFTGEYREVVEHGAWSTPSRWPTSTATCCLPRSWACPATIPQRPRSPSSWRTWAEAPVWCSRTPGFLLIPPEPSDGPSPSTSSQPPRGRRPLDLVAGRRCPCCAARSCCRARPAGRTCGRRRAPSSG